MDKNPLVEDEGVNAGSADQLDDDRDPKFSSAAVRAGGHPEDVEPVAPVGDLDPVSEGENSGLIGAPDGSGRTPGGGPGSSGQDAGSIE